MKVILTVTGPVAAQDAAEIVAAWKDEHQGYYGAPHGTRTILHGLEASPCGYSVVPVSLPPCGTTVYAMAGHRWLSCAGNDHRISIWSGGVIVAYEGRRHGMRPEFRAFLEDYWREHVDGSYELTPRLYLTQEPEWMPWWTQDRQGQETED